MALPVLPIPCASRANAGKPSTATAASVVQSIEAAVGYVRRGEASAVVTNPIAKHVLYEAGFQHPGHTEFLAELARPACGGQRPTPVMLLASELLKVSPLTIHEPIERVPSLISAERITATVEILDAGLKHDFGIAEPRIAISGLNPHAGEDGAIGRQELEVIAPAIAELKGKGLRVVGPLSADTMFHQEARATYDVALTMYHDQALIPIKTLAFDTGVNVTLGLPFVRTSPDHGTAFDLAGTGRASPNSLIAALRLAHEMAERRKHGLVRAP